MSATISQRSGNQGEHLVPQQLSIAFDPGLAERHRSLKECVAACVYQQRGGITAVAGRLDMQPSHLSEVLGGGGDRGRKFDLDELERYMRAYQDVTPILYLAAVYLGDASAEQTAELQRMRALAEQLVQMVGARTAAAPRKRWGAR